MEPVTQEHPLYNGLHRIWLTNHKPAIIQSKGVEYLALDRGLKFVPQRQADGVLDQYYANDSMNRVNANIPAQDNVVTIEDTNPPSGDPRIPNDSEEIPTE